MRTKFCLIVLSALFIAFAVFAQTPPTADEVLAKAKARAAEEHKSVFLSFDASW